MIYQLMKTTPYLGGQVRLDLVADKLSGDSTVYIDEIHIRPITDSVWAQTDENQINNHHVDNIAELYKRTRDTFFSALGDTHLSGTSPYFNPDGIVEDTCDHTYQMGLRRLNTSDYAKDLSYLLPMWIDSADYLDNLDFFIHVESCVTDTETGEPVKNELTSKKVELSERLRNYLKEYLSGVSQDLMYIGLRDHSAYITGLEVTSGTVLTKDVSRVISPLLERERPLIETDDMVMRLFAENQMIARQLVNFNLCFSINDLFSPIIDQEMHWSQLNIWVEARMKDISGKYQEIPLKDLYSNYTNILSYKIDENPLKGGTYVDSWTDPRDGEEYHFNVLDYLQDNHCIDLIHTNKIVQPDIHWAFQDNLKYTWNLYNGFSPLVDSENDDPRDTSIVKRIEGRFFSTPDVMSKDYAMFRNNIQWIKVLDGTSDIVPGSFVGLSMNTGSTTQFKPNDYGLCWSKGIRYNIGTILEDGSEYKIDTETGKEIVRFTSDGIGANVVVIRDTSEDHLRNDRIYVAVLRKNVSGEYQDFISLIYVTSGDILDYEHLNDMTFLSVRKMLSTQLYQASQQEINDVFSEVRNIEFKNLYVCAISDTTGLNAADENTPEFKLVYLFRKILDSVEYPNMIRFEKSLGTRPAAAPAVNLSNSETTGVEYATEMNYVKIDRNYSTYILRYDGNLLPQFIDPEMPKSEIVDGETGEWKTSESGAFNMVYRRKQWTEMTNQEKERYNYLSKQKFNPDYPSIDYYYTVGEVQKLDYPFVPEDYLGEITWFRQNRMYYTENQFTLTEILKHDEMTEEKIREMFHDYIIRHGAFVSMDTNKADEIIYKYLWNMYTYTYDWEYLDERDITTYKFKVVYRLK